MRTVFPLPLGVLALVLAGGCELAAFAERDAIPGGDGGAGGVVIGGPCVKPIDCAGSETGCRAWACVEGQCELTPIAQGTPSGNQLAGDCQRAVCDAHGKEVLVPDDDDRPVDGNACTDDRCVGGVPANPLSVPGTTCAEGKGRVCDGAGVCVGCLGPGDCAGQPCLQGMCLPLSCVDQAKGGSESDVDCGGSECPPCVDGKGCTKFGDCQSGICVFGLCQPPGCGDGIKNGPETDVDCGGGCPSPCGAAKGCVLDGDCLGGSCVGGVCAPTCTDAAKNGAETDVDCGGGGCLPCAGGKGCGSGDDCASGSCNAGACALENCMDGLRNGNETDVDCGGICPGCATSKLCATDGDCVDHVCTGGHCAAATCVDLHKNGGESDVDCGGAVCAACKNGQLCGAPGDCLTGICSGGVCAVPGCNDGLKDGAELGVDCGGGTCPGCPAGTVCGTSADCASLVCDGGTCAVPTCNDGFKNGGESDLDCGGPCGPCVVGAGCVVGMDCVAGVCAGGHCAAASCTDGVENGFESGLDCGGACLGCVGAPCLLGAECATSICTASLCAAPSCGDGLKNGTETGIDCGGSCQGCAAGSTCFVDTDCATAFCGNGTCSERLLISEVRSRGLGGGGDEFVEIYNPNNAQVVMDNTWTVALRTAVGTCTQAPANAPAVIFTFGNQVIPAHRHFLIGGSAYNQAPAKDATLISPVVDAGSMTLRHAGAVVDAVCFYYDLATQQKLLTCATPYVCEGDPISNLPHDGTSTAMSTTDVSFERGPGGAAGNGHDTGSSTADFLVMVSPATPQSLASPAVP